MAKKELANCSTPEEVEAWATAQEKPLHTKMVTIDKQIAALRKTKQGIHAEIHVIEDEAVIRKQKIKAADPTAGPDQELIALAVE